MEPCTVETGFLRKKPCGHAAVTQCENCERPLCAQHAVAQVSEARKKTGAFMCKECDEARREYDKGQIRVAENEKEKRAAEIMNSIAHPPAPKPRAAANAAPQAPAAPASPDDGGSLEFTPGKVANAPSEPDPKSGARKADGEALEFTPGDTKK